LQKVKKELIKLEGICKDYGHGEAVVHAVCNVDLTITEGEFVAVMGPSGSGKSTLMHLMGMLDRPTHGKYYFGGEDIAKMSEKELAVFRGREIGFVFQAFNLLPRVSVLRNIEMPMIYQRIQAKERRKRALNLLAKFGLSKRIKHRPSELSGGEKQRVAIVRALVNNASLVLADEPTGNLDSKTTLEIMKIFSRLHRDGKTIVMVTHERELARFADRLIEMKDGEIVADKRI